MGFKNVERQSIRPGQLVEYVVDELAEIDGKKPRFYVEYYSPNNSTVLGALILSAGKTEEPSAPRKPPETDREAFEAFEASWKANREMLARHCVRGVGGFFHDGPNGEPDLNTPATVDDIPDILAALPYTALMRLFGFCIKVKLDEEKTEPLGETAKK